MDIEATVTELALTLSALDEAQGKRSRGLFQCPDEP